MFFSNSPGSLKSSILKSAGSFGMRKPLPQKMVVKHSIKQNGGLPGQDMSSFHPRFFCHFLDPKTLRLRSCAQKPWPLVLSQWPKTLRFWRTKTPETAYENQGESALWFFDLVWIHGKTLLPNIIRYKSSVSIIFLEFLIHTSQFNPSKATFCNRIPHKINWPSSTLFCTT